MALFVIHIYLRNKKVINDSDQFYLYVCVMCLEYSLMMISARLPHNWVGSIISDFPKYHRIIIYSMYYRFEVERLGHEIVFRCKNNNS